MAEKGVVKSVFGKCEYFLLHFIFIYHRMALYKLEYVYLHTAIANQFIGSYHLLKHNKLFKDSRRFAAF